MKIVLAGDGAVGKTALRERYLGRGFKSQYLQTIGADFALNTVKIGGKDVKFQIWDLAGQTRFTAVRSVYYTGCLGALLLFDITRRESFDNLQSWLDEIWKHNGKGMIPVVLLGNKYDLKDDVPDHVGEKEAEAYAKKLTKKTVSSSGFKVKFMNTSAKSGLNVSEAFETLGKVYFDFKKKGN